MEIPARVCFRAMIIARSIRNHSLITVHVSVHGRYRRRDVTFASPVYYLYYRQANVDLARRTHTVELEI